MPASALENTLSPYLKLHKDNPVQWRLWDAGTLAEARALGKPIFLSSGYSGCHWCHVMNQESFSDPEIAALINDNFIPILIDREERPDIDQLYQSAMPFMGATGGWPLNLFLAPDGAPFFVTGYVPREERLGQQSFRSILENVIGLWSSRNTQALEQAGQIRSQLEGLYDRDLRAAPESIILDGASMRTAQAYCIFFGGQIGQPKFPQPCQLELLWRAYLRSGVTQYSQLLFTTLDHMLFGGIYDHIGGGFFRYVTDERWMIPHFEKSLNDNAQIIEILTSVWQSNRSDLARLRVEETIIWLLREMKLPGGGFAAGLDSSSENEDGRFYLWSEAEIDAALTGTFTAKFKAVYEVSRDGNHAGRNILRRLGSGQVTNDADEALLAKQRAMLLTARERRVRPARDDKVLANWNGLAIAALAQAGAVFERQDWVVEAITAFDSVVAALGDAATLYHSAVEGQRGAEGFADDYADMARAALMLFEVTGDNRFVAPARAWVETLDKHFWDAARGGYCFTSDQADPLLIRTRMIYDNPSPPSNSTMLGVLSRLMLITGESAFAARGAQLLRSFGAEVPRMFMSMASYVNNAESFSQALQIVIFGPKASAKTHELIRTVWGKALPNRFLRVVEPGEVLPAGHPAAALGMKDGQPTAYVCEATACSAPIQGAVALSQLLTLPQVPAGARRA